MKEQSTTKGFAILSMAGMLVKVLSVLYIPILMKIIGEEDMDYMVHPIRYMLLSLCLPIQVYL